MKDSAAARSDSTILPPQSRIAELFAGPRRDIDARDVDTNRRRVIHGANVAAVFMLFDSTRLQKLTCSWSLSAMPNSCWKHLDADPECVRVRVDDEHFPMINSKAGGTIYNDAGGTFRHDVARQFGHGYPPVAQDRSPADVKWIAACWLADETAVRSCSRKILTSPPDCRRPPSPGRPCRLQQPAALRVMLAAGLPVNILGQPARRCIGPRFMGMSRWPGKSCATTHAGVATPTSICPLDGVSTARARMVLPDEITRCGRGVDRNGAKLPEQTGHRCR